MFIALCSLNDGLYGWLTFVQFHCSALMCALYEHHPRILFDLPVFIHYHDILCMFLYHSIAHSLNY